MRYRFIHHHRWQFPVGRMCALLAVSRSGYYGWRRRPERTRTQQNRRLLVAIRTVHQTARASMQSCGLKGTAAAGTGSPG